MRERGNGSKQSISCLDKALSVAEGWHTVFSLTDTSQRCACTTHAHTHTNTSSRRESFSGQSSLRLRLCALLFAAIVFRHTHIQSHSFTSPKTKATKGKMPSLHYTYQSQTVTVTQVKHTLVVDLNGSSCVIQRGFLTLLLTRVERRSDTVQL